MLLQSLYELYDRLKGDEDYRIAPLGYSLQKVAFRVVLSPDGRLHEIQDLRVVEGKRLRPRQMLVPGGAKPSGSGLNPCFLWDNSAYMLGFKPEDDDPDRTRRCCGAFREKHLQIERQIASPSFAAVCRFLEAWNPDSASHEPVLGEIASGFGVFQIQGEPRYVHQDPEVAAWWENSLGEEDPEDKAQCLITGRVAPIAKTHDKIKGVRGAQSAGAVIVSFNEPAYESYAKSQSLNAPVSEVAAFRYTTAINAMLDGPMSDKHRMTLGDMTVLFWTDRPTVTEDIFIRFATEGSASVTETAAQDKSVLEKLGIFLHALRAGKERYGELDEDPDRTEYGLLGLSPNAGRLSVRFFLRGRLTGLLDNLRAHFDDIRIKPEEARGGRKADPEFPPSWLLLAQTAREAKEIPPILGGGLFRAIVEGRRYPDAFYSAILRRIQADRTLNYPRACALKGYLNRNRKKELPMSLDKNRPDPAYRLGRLFAALEKTQLDALGHEINATIRDRFYGSASATPRAVFPRLLRTYQHHLAGLDGGRKVNREKLVQEIVDPLDTIPAHLGLEGQGMFAIGYYQQMRDFYTKKTDGTD